MARFCDRHYFYDVSASRKESCKVKRLLNSAIQNKSSSYRELARIAGSIISVALAVGPISRLLTRQMYLAIESRSALGSHFSLPTCSARGIEVLVL